MGLDDHLARLHILLLVDSQNLVTTHFRNHTWVGAAAVVPDGVAAHFLGRDCLEEVTLGVGILRVVLVEELVI